MNEKTARLILDDIRVKQRLGSFNMKPPAVRVRFKDIAPLYWQKHYEDYRDPETHQPRTKDSKGSVKANLGALVDYFGDFYFDAIKPKDIAAFKAHVIEVEGNSNGTFNKKKGLLSSIYGHIITWVKLEEMDPIKLPDVNPCEFVADLKEHPRDRVATLEELKRLKTACFSLHDEGLWSITEVALDTTARKGDLIKLGNVEIRDGQIRIIQDKTGMELVLPASIKPIRPMVYENLRKRWLKACEAAGVVNFQFRDLRRTGAHMLQLLNVSTKLISQTLGHKSERTTEWYLQHKDTKALEPLLAARKKLIEAI